MATKKKIKTTASPDLLKNWHDLNAHIKELDEKQAWDLLEQEKNGKRRLGFLMRLYGRFNMMRTERERGELAMRKLEA